MTGRFTEQQIREMRALLKDAGSREMREVGKRYGISRTHMYRIKKGETWTWLPDEPAA